MRKLVFLSVIIFLCNSFTNGQQQVTGKITNAKDNSPIAGATIKAVGTKKATVSLNDGSFAITVDSKVKSLLITFVGYADKEVPITNSMMNISLVESVQSLNEVVVVGYGNTVKRNLTGSIAKVESKDIENYPTPSFESALQGKAAGVVIESGSGKLGQGIKIRIRGTSSISANSQPLYIVDGLPVTSTSQSDESNDDTDPLVDINPNDIESVEVLKDASASAIYGARAANGVVLITTKKGKLNQKTSIELDLTGSESNPARERKFLDAKQYVDLIEIAEKDDAYYDYTNGYFPTLKAAQKYYKNFYESNVLDEYSLGTDWQNAAVNTNWQDLLFHKNAPSKEANLSFSGGNDKTRFFVSGFYDTQDAIVINNKFYRYGGRLNLENKASDRLTVGINLSVDRSQLNRVTNDDAFSTPGQLVAQLPISPEYDPTTGQLNGNTLYANGLFDAQYNSDIQVTYRTLGNAFANYTILPSLSFRSELGADILNLTEQSFEGKETIDGGGTDGLGGLIVTQNASINTNNYFTYTPDLGKKSKLDAVAGMSYLQNDAKKSVSSGQTFPSDAIKNLSGATVIIGAPSTDNRYTFLSYFMRANYSFDEKYLFSASVRADGSSRFGPDHRYGWFPALSAGWVLSDENFMKNISFLNFFKLRASWGLTGNAEIGESNFLALYGVSNYPDLPGYVPVSLSDPDLKWEQTAQSDIGFDFAVLHNKLTGEFDYYKKHTTDLLLDVNTPATTSYSNVYQNLGSMDNTGVELTLNSTNIDGKFKWSTSFNVAYNKNKVLDIGGQIIEGGFTLIQRAVEGLPIGEFYGQKFLGVDPKNGDALFLGKNGKPTSNFDDAVQVPLGNSNPNWTGGITNTFSYKGFDLNVFFSFVSGNMINNAAGYFMSDGFYNGFDNQTVDMLNAWQTPGQKTDVPRIGYWDGSGYQYSSSRWLYDGSYIRLKNLTLGYTLPQKVAQQLRLASARLYLEATNLLTFTKYPGDPEVNVETIANIGGGQDFYTIPQAKTITIGLSVKF